MNKSQEEIHDHKINVIDSLLIKQIESHKTPSIQYTIFTPDHVIYKFQLGFADIKNRLRTDSKTKYNAFSVTKTFTALAVLQLEEREKLNINQPVKKYLPDFPYSPDITIKQLLNHTAGIPNPVPLNWIHPEADHKSFDQKEFFKAIYTKYPSVKSKPNRKFSYSNLGYVILGQLIENVSGVKYVDYVHENIINQLNIKDHYLDFEIGDKSHYAKGYHKYYSFSNAILSLFIDKRVYMDKPEGKWKSFKFNYVNGPSYGGLIGTSEAFVKYVREFLKQDCCLITDYYKDLLFNENKTDNGKPTGMCLSWFTGMLNGNRYYTHAGGGGGYYCEVRIYRKLGIGSVLMTNRTGMSDERFLNKLDRYFIGEK